MRDIKTFLANLSQHPGVYQMLDDKQRVIYVGKAKNLKKRVASYFSSRVKDPKTLSLVSQIKDINVTITNTENEAVLLECNLIKKHKPRYNILLRDDKSYPYIIISKHKAPRIDLYRGARTKQGLFFGPYPNSTAARETISLLQKIFLIRTCSDSFFDARTRPCLLYQIGRCTAPCVNYISTEDYNQNVALAILFLEGKSDLVITELQSKMEVASKKLDYENAAFYRDQIARLRQIQERQYVDSGEGNADIIGFASEAGVTCIQLLTIRHGQILGSQSYFPSVPLDSSPEEIISAFITQHYLNDKTHLESIPKQIILDYVLQDQAVIQDVLNINLFKPQRGDKIKWLQMATTNALQALKTHLFTKMNMQDRILDLQKVLGLAKIPRRIECFDISHSMGEATVGSCVVFNAQGAVKSDYRRFNITEVTPGDDVAAMHQVLLRRFKKLQKDEAVFPDIVFIDGGKTQLGAARKALNELNIDTVLLMGVSKGPDRKAGFETLHREGLSPMHLPADSLALHFIQQIRDEAHRFAITGHRARRDKKRRQSSLEFIPGIGVKRRRELLRYFGGIQGIAHASLDELLKVPGINRSLAERLLISLHDTTI